MEASQIETKSFSIANPFVFHINIVKEIIFTM